MLIAHTVLYSKIRLKVLDAEKHLVGAEAVRGLNRTVCVVPNQEGRERVCFISDRHLCGNAMATLSVDVVTVCGKRDCCLGYVN